MNWRHSGQAQALQILGLTSLRGESSHRAANRQTFHLGHSGPWPDYCHGLRNGKASLSCFPPDHLSWLPWPSGIHKGILFFFLTTLWAWAALCLSVTLCQRSDERISGRQMEITWKSITRSWCSLQATVQFYFLFIFLPVPWDQLL